MLIRSWMSNWIVISCICFDQGVQPRVDIRSQEDEIVTAININFTVFCTKAFEMCPGMLKMSLFSANLMLSHPSIMTQHWNIICQQFSIVCQILCSFQVKDCAQSKLQILHIKIKGRGPRLLDWDQAQLTFHTWIFHYKVSYFSNWFPGASELLLALLYWFKMC